MAKDQGPLFLAKPRPKLTVPTALAQTYDPQVLRTMRVRSVKPDPSKAKAYYEQAEAAQKRR